MARTKLSERQKAMLEFIGRFTEENGYPPTIRQIGEDVAISSTSVVNYNLHKLEKEGYIARDLRVSRGIRLANRLETMAEGLRNLVRIPLVGRIVAGEPMPVPSADFAPFGHDEAITFTRDLLPGADDLFALQVKGDSMVDAMVSDGDIVVMKPAHEARNGEMVAVWLKDREETTLKHFYLENGRVRLQPANATMKPIFVEDPANVEIQGKVMLVLRQLA